MLLIRLYDFLFGYVSLKIRGEMPEKFINFLIRSKIRFRSLKRLGDGALAVSISSRLYNAAFFDSAAEKLRLNIELYKKRGVRYLLERHKMRLGLFLGILCGLGIMYISSLYVWDVKIEYSDYPGDGEILTLLRELGVKPGARIKSLDIDKIQNEILLRENRVKWIALNISGTVVHTEIKKSDPLPIIEDRFSPQNIVAKTSGFIVSVEAHEGQAVVVPGTTVEKGDLLISGLVDSASLGLRVKHALGRIMAETERVIEVRIPYVSEKKYFTGAEEKKNSLSLLGRDLNLFINGGTVFSDYEATESEENIKILGFIELPLTVKTKKYSETAFEFIILDQNQAKNIALLKIDDIIEDELRGLEILSKEYAEHPEENYFLLRCRLTCLEDIAEEKAFDTNIKTEK